MSPTAETASMTMVEAIRDAIDTVMGRDEQVVVFGEDVGYFGGVFRCTEGLQEKYGAARVFDAPINESGIIGVAVGMASYGLKPIAERGAVYSCGRIENRNAVEPDRCKRVVDCCGRRPGSSDFL